MASPLAGVRVLDLSWVIAGPSATRVLRELGAEVIKVEPPGRGDSFRNGDLSRADLNFGYWNYGKKSISVDLKTEEGRELVRELARRSDVLVENFRTGVLENLGLGAGALREINPRLIYCSITGFGHASPESHRGAQAAIVHAISGVMAMVGEKDEPPLPPPGSMADPVTGFHAAIAICAALYGREKTGRGTTIDLAMLDAMVFLMGPMAERRSLGLRHGWAQRMGRLNRVTIPVGAFEGKDGWLMLSGGIDDVSWGRTAAAIGRPDLAKYPAAWRHEHLDEVYQVLGDWVAGQPSVSDAERLLMEADVLAARINTPEEMAALEHLRVRGAIQPVVHPALGPMDVTNAPYYFDGEKPDWAGPAPALGEHNADILGRVLGMSKEEVSRLEESGVLFRIP